MRCSSKGFEQGAKQSRGKAPGEALQRRAAPTTTSALASLV
ncbi:MAG: hypothetical protein ACK53K_02150 [Burkholderiales bacterium]